jgi:hypothetical protein
VREALRFSATEAATAQDGMHDALTVHVHRRAARNTSGARCVPLYTRTSADASVAILSFATAMQCTALRVRACALKLRTRPSASCGPAALLPAPPNPRATLSSVVIRPLHDMLPATSFPSFQRGQSGRPTSARPLVRLRIRSYAQVEMRALAVHTELPMRQSP